MRTLRSSATSLVPVLALALGCGGPATEPAPSSFEVPPRVEKPNVVLVTLDTTRADHLGAWGWPHAQTPNLDRLAARGARFERCDTAAPITLPSHATLMTGLLPPRHGVRDNGTFSLGPQPATLAEAFSAAGYSTAAVVSASVLARRYGLDRGFEVYDDDLGSGGDAFAESAERAAGPSTDAALGHLERLPAPYFLWLHYFDPHERYAAPDDVRAGAGGPTPDYDAELAYLDRELGRLLAALGPETLVVVVGDHGEMLGDHGEDTHGLLLRAGARRVPLILAGPGVPRGQTVRCLVRTADVAPTVVDLAGLRLAADLDGRSLTPMLGADGDCGETLAYSETFLPLYSYRWHPLRALSDGTRLYVAAGEGRLYDLEADPAESNDLTAERPDEAAVWERRLRDLLAGMGESPGQAASPTGRLDAAERARLESLGYLGGAGPVDGDSLEGLPDPASEVEVARRLHESARAAQDGRCAAALPDLVRLLREHPDLLPAANLTGLCLLEAGRFSEALAAFETASRLNPDDAVPVANAGHALLRLGRHEEAVERYRLAVELDPGAAGAAPNLAALLRQAGRSEEARGVLDRAAAAGVLHPGLDLERGMLAAEAGDFESAFASFRKGAERDRANPVPLGNAARAAMLLGRWREAADLYEAMLELVPENAEVWASLGGIYADRLGEPTLARICFERARRESTDPRMNAQLEAALRRLGPAL